MKSKEFNKHREEFFKTAMVLSDAKSVEYTISNEDRLYNFKHVAARTGITPIQALMVYVLKHVDAICNDAKTGKQFSDETFMSRAHDICNYMVLATALHKETHINENSTEPTGNRTGIISGHSQDDIEPKEWSDLKRQKEA